MIRQIAAKDIDQHWEVIKPMLERAIIKSKCNDYDIVDVYNYISNKQWRLYVVEEDSIIGAMAVAFQVYPHDIVAYITVIGGRAISTKEHSNQFFDLLKAAGAHRIQGACSPAVVRLWRRLGLQPKYQIVESTL